MKQKYHWMTAVLAIALFPLRAPVTESLTWTEQPSNPIEAIKGQHVSLTWRYSLTADELTKSSTFLLITWKKFNPSSSAYDQLASRTKVVNQVAAYSEPSAPRIVIDRATGTKFSSLEIDNVRLEDEGSYEIEISVEFPGTVTAAHDVVNLTVSVPPEIVFVSTDTDICEGSNVTLSCNATGVPPPTISWTRVAGDGKDSGALPTVDGSYVMNNVSRRSNGTYRCTAINRAGVVNRTIQLTVRYSASVDKIVNSSNTVNEGSYFNMTCEASGVPEPTNYTWIGVKLGQQYNGKVLTIKNIAQNDAGEYRCEVENRCGKGSESTTVVVYFAPNITDISTNQTLNEGDIVALNCTASGNPTPTITWTRISDNSVVTMPFAISRSSEGGYKCTVYNGIGNPASSYVFIDVQNYRPTDTNLTTKLTNNTVVLNEPFILMCSADAKPPAHYRLYNQQQPLTTITDNQAVGAFTTSVGERIKQVTYMCAPFNSFGVGPSDTAIVTVHFSPSATSNGRNETVLLGTPVNFTCPVDGNPPPSVRWYKGSEPSGTVLSSKNEFEFVPTSLCDTGLYTCSASNYLGNIIVSFGLTVVEQPSPATPSPTTPREMTVMEITLIITNKDCNNFAKEEFRVEVKNTLEHLGLKDIEIKTRCGSVIADLGLGFNQSVGENDVVSTLKDAARSGRFGDFKVDPDSIRQISSISTSSPSSTKTQSPPECSCSCNTVLWVIIGILAAIIIVLIMIIVWQHKKGTTTRPYEVPPRNAGFYDVNLVYSHIPLFVVVCLWSSF